MRWIQKLKQDTGGNVLMLTGLAILFLFAMAGAGVDFGRQQLVRMKLQNASDAAAVAAASMPASVSAEQRRAVALRYYNLNFPTTYLGVPRPTPNIQIGEQIIVDASTSFNANFVSNVGVQELQSQGRTVVDRSAPEATVYDVILVMDNSRSMAEATTAPTFAYTPQNMLINSRALKIPTCETEMRRSNAGCQAGLYYMADQVTLRPFSQNNCQFEYPRQWCSFVSNNSTAIKSGIPNAGKEIYGFGFLGNNRLNALRHVALNFVSRIIDDGEPGSRIALIPWSDNVGFTQPLTSNTNTLREAINRMGAWGATAPVPAMQQAISFGNDFNARHVKAVVFMSDGKPTAQSGTSCNGTTYCPSAVNSTLPLCTQLKNAGVQVYTVGFLNPSDSEFAGRPQDFQNAQNFLRNCASVDAEGNPRYYGAQNGAELELAFTQILTSLGRIRISQ